VAKESKADFGYSLRRETRLFTRYKEHAQSDSQKIPAVTKETTSLARLKFAWLLPVPVNLDLGTDADIGVPEFLNCAV